MAETPTPLLVKVLFGAAIAACAALSACSTVEGLTPTCTYNVDDGGIVPDENGCVQFATCEKDKDNPAACCVDDQGKPLTGTDLDECLWSYGKGSGTTTGAGGGGGGTG